MSPITKISLAKIGRGLWFGALAVALVVAAQIAAQRGAQIEEYPYGCDSFGYLRMAQEIQQAARQGELPRFHLESEHTRLLINLMRSRDVSPNLWDEMIAPHAHHYFPRANHVGVQYPPGTGLLLALFPPDEAVRGLNRAVVLVFLAMGLLLLTLIAAARVWVSAGFVVLALYLGLDILGNMGNISFSINAVLVPLLLSFVCVFAALRMGEREGAEGSGGGGLITSARLYALAGGIFMGLAVLVRLPVVFLLPGLLVLLWPPAWRALFKSTLFAFGLGVLLCGIVPLLVHQHRLAGAWYLTTYGNADSAPPSFAALVKNVPFFLGAGAGSTQKPLLFVLGLGFVGFLLYFYRHRRDDATANFNLSWQRLILSVLTLWALPTIYFLTHEIAVHYYLLPSTFGAALLLALGTLHLESRIATGKNSRDEMTKFSWPRTAALLVALLPGLVALDHARFRFSSAFPDAPAAATARAQPRRLDVPADLREPRAWVWGDLLTGTLWYYERVPAHKIAFTDTATRVLAYRLAFERGEPQYLVRDSDIMQLISDEIIQLGGRLEPRGEIDRNPYFLIHWPPNGPATND